MQYIRRSKLWPRYENKRTLKPVKFHNLKRVLFPVAAQLICVKEWHVRAVTYIRKTHCYVYVRDVTDEYAGQIIRIWLCSTKFAKKDDITNLGWHRANFLEWYAIGTCNVTLLMNEALPGCMRTHIVGYMVWMACKNLEYKYHTVL